MVLSHLIAVEIDGTVMTGPFEGEQDPLALPFGRNMQMTSVAADHLVEIRQNSETGSPYRYEGFGRAAGSLPGILLQSSPPESSR